MTVEVVTTFFALLACLAIAVTFVSLVLWIVVRFTGGPAWAMELRRSIQPLALPFAWAVAMVCTFGSLYLSEVAHFTPCLYCWYQRIAMYPLALILGVAALRKDTKVWLYAVPLAGIGMAISTYHYLLERFPDSVNSACSTDVPCTAVWIWKFHFLSIPGMAWAGFGLIITLSLLARALPTPTTEDDQ